MLITRNVFILIILVCIFTNFIIFIQLSNMFDKLDIKYIYEPNIFYVYPNQMPLVKISTCFQIKYIYQYLYNLTIFDEINVKYNTKRSNMQSINDVRTKGVNIKLSIPILKEYAHLIKYPNPRYLFIVQGIPSIDTVNGRFRRDMIRKTWKSYENVFNPATNPNGTMAVYFFVGKHWSNNFTLTNSVIDEARAYGDIIFVEINEQRPTTNKKLGQNSKVGAEN